MNSSTPRTGSGTHSRGREAPPSAPSPGDDGPRSARGGGKEAPPSTTRRWLGRGLLLAAMAMAVHAAWLPAKAQVAQHLLKGSWSQRLADGGTHRPWPWADTHAVARLRQSRLGIDQIVLAGDSGRPLAFGPGWAEASAAPGSAVGTTIISGHRDTHFAWLEKLRPGDTVTLETPQGPRDFTVAAMQVVDSRLHRIATGVDDGRLVLVTCWPFDATAPRGPMRYVVTLGGGDEERLATDERG
ncbi:class GN sortase [Arenimonas sp. MALMAid1274]|uniref:class GN sortase n=1 Tax=Arenimonas sp. MALMAid1274 TaxID=3411630 RepID=UPI003BA0B4F4